MFTWDTDIWPYVCVEHFIIVRLNATWLCLILEKRVFSKMSCITFFLNNTSHSIFVSNIMLSLLVDIELSTIQWLWALVVWHELWINGFYYYYFFQGRWWFWIFWFWLLYIVIVWLLRASFLTLGCVLKINLHSLNGLRHCCLF